MNDKYKEIASHVLWWFILAVSIYVVSKSITDDYMPDAANGIQSRNSMYMAGVITLILLSLFLAIWFFYKKLLSKISTKILGGVVLFVLGLTLILNAWTNRTQEPLIDSSATIIEGADTPPQWADDEIKKFRESVFSASSGRERYSHWLDSIMGSQERDKDRAAAIREAKRNGDMRPKKLLDHESGIYEIYTEEDNSWWLEDTKSGVLFRGPYYVVCAQAGHVYYKELLFLEKTAPYKKGVWVKREDAGKVFPQIPVYQKTTDSGCISEELVRY